MLFRERNKTKINMLNKRLDYKKIRKTSISQRFIRYFIIIFLIPLLAGAIVSYLIQSDASSKKAVMLNRDINARTKMNIEMVFSLIENVANDIAFNPNTQKWMKEYWESAKGPSTDNKIELRSILSDYQIKSNYLISNVVLFTSNGYYFSDIGFYKDWANIKDYNFAETIKESNGENIWLPAHIDNNDPSTGGENVISLVKKILIASEDNMGTNIGYLLINVKETELHNLLNVYGNQSEELMLVSEKSSIISHKDKNMIGKTFDISSILNYSEGNYYSEYNSRKSLIVYSRMAKTGWYLIGVLDTATILKDSRQYLFVLIIVTAVLFLIFTYITVILSKRISNPIVGLYKQMKKVEEGDFNITFDKSSDILEVDELLKGFNVMVYKLNNLINEVYSAEIKGKQLEVEVRQAELEALQQQINPHFLYNTLDCINWMASLEGNNNVANMVTALGNYFRSSVHRGKNFVTIEEEVKNIQDYLYIQQIRHGCKFITDIRVQQDTLQCRTMKLLLQPLVENAIIHGIEPKVGSGIITVDITLADEMLIIIVADDGVGISTENLQKIIDNKSNNGKGSIGLRNVLERLKLYYGDKCTYKIDSTVGDGTTITITIPCFENNEIK